MPVSERSKQKRREKKRLARERRRREVKERRGRKVQQEKRERNEVLRGPRPALQKRNDHKVQWLSGALVATGMGYYYTQFIGLFVIALGLCFALIGLTSFRKIPRVIVGPSPLEENKKTELGRLPAKTELTSSSSAPSGQPFGVPSSAGPAAETVN